MGGWGSGVYPRYKGRKKTVESLKSIDIREWKKKGMLDDYEHHMLYWYNYLREKASSLEVWTQPNQVTLHYLSLLNGSQEIKYNVRIAYTNCNYGGWRPWFVCPGRNCGKRVAKLYLDGIYFLCRHCYNLTYKSRNKRRKTFEQLVKQVLYR